MGSMAHPQAGYDTTELPIIVRGSLKLGLAEALIVAAIGLVSRFLDGPVEIALEAVILAFGVLLVVSLPGIWTRARSIEGIAGAAGIGLGAAAVFLVLDLVFLQGDIFHGLTPSLYTNRWRAIGGGSNWWYHPVWWMVGTYLPWLGGWILANQTRKSGAPSLPGLAILLGICTVVCGVIAVLVGFPGAGWNVPTFGVAVLPGLALATTISVLGARKA
ncbi:MAG TPA: hypothetical protein VFU03_08300 [Gemmatimonadales bacterium]|nr:hypothetical protein [Gemmatimonadales bacterium]